MLELSFEACPRFPRDDPELPASSPGRIDYARTAVPASHFLSSPGAGLHQKSLPLSRSSSSPRSTSSLRAVDRLACAPPFVAGSAQLLG